MKRILISASAIASLLLAGSAVAAPYAGPWDSAHQPPTITSPNVTTTISPVSFAVDGWGLCSSGTPSMTLTFSDPSGWRSYAYNCGGSFFDFTETSGGSPDFFSYFVAGSGSYAAPVSSESSVTPLLFTISGPNGLIAQGAYTWKITVAPTVTTEIDQDTDIDGFINICLGHPYPIHSKNGGHLYCTITTGGEETTTITPGWPPPPPTCIVPSLVGVPLAQAQSALSSAHCQIGVSRAYSPTVKSGRVINQDQKPGTVLSAGAPVDLLVSLGPDKCQVYWRSIRNGDQRCPRTHSVISDMYWSKLRWTVWNAREAIGTGREVYRNGICSGVPVRCRATSVPLRIRLGGTKMCGEGKRIYSRISAVTYSANGRRVTRRDA